MHPILRSFLRMNWILFALTMVMCGYGVYAIYSATWMRDHHFWTSQIIWILISLPMFFVVSLLDYRWVRFGAIPIYMLSILLLVATMLFGQKRYGARSWLDLGPMSFQPSELAVAAGILTLAIFLQYTRTLAPFLRSSTTGLPDAVSASNPTWLKGLISPAVTSRFNFDSRSQAI